MAGELGALSRNRSSKIWGQATPEAAREAWQWLKRNGGGTVTLLKPERLEIGAYYPVGSDHQIAMADGGHPSNRAWWYQDADWYPE